MMPTNDNKDMSEAELLRADDDWDAFFSAGDPENLAWLEHVTKLLNEIPEKDNAGSERTGRPIWYALFRIAVMKQLPGINEITRASAEEWMRDPRKLKGVLIRTLNSWEA
jgi:hypothetical protein